MRIAVVPDLQIDPILSLPQHARWLSRKRVTLWRRAIAGSFGPAVPIPGSHHVGYALSAVAEYYGIMPTAEQLHSAMTTKPDRAAVPERVQMPRHRFRQFIADEIRRRDARWRAWR